MDILLKNGEWFDITGLGLAQHMLSDNVNTRVISEKEAMESIK